MLPEQMKLIGQDVPSYCNEWINIKKAYNAVMKRYPKHLQFMLDGLGLQFEGRPHSGIDDCKNIAKIVKTLGFKGHSFENTFQR